MFKLRPAEFAATMIMALRNAGIDKNFEYCPAEFCLRAASDQSETLYLDNIYNVYCSRPFWSRRAIIDRHARSIQLTLANIDVTTFEQARPLLRAIIRSRFYREQIRLHALAEGVESIDLSDRTLAEHLTIDVAIDLPTSIMSVGAQQLDEWGVTFDDALSIGLENLKAATSGTMASGGPNVYVSQWNDGYDASRMLLTDWFTSLKLTGRPVVMIPSANVLLVTGEGDADGLLAMAKTAKEIWTKDPKPLVSTAFILSSTWSPYLPDPQNNAYQLLLELALDNASRTYADQARSLDNIHAKQNVDVYLAPFGVMTHKATAVTISYSIWSRGIDTSLPVVDEIIFNDPTDEGKALVVGKVRWDKVVDVAGDLMIPEDLYPPRYRVRGFPTDAQFEAMELHRPK